MNKIIKIKIQKSAAYLMALAVIIFSVNMGQINADEINTKIDNNDSIIQEYNSGNKEHVRFSIGDLYATSEFNGKLVVNIGNSVQSSTITASKGERLKGSILMPVINGDYKISLLNSDIKVFDINGSLNQTKDGYTHQLGSILPIEFGVRTIPNSSGFNIDIGYVKGGMKVELETIDMAPGDCEVKVFLDNNADGEFQSEESFKKIINQDYSLIEGPVIERLPLTSKYDVSTYCKGFKVASNTGSYDLVNGEAVNSKKDKSDSIRSFGVGFLRTPHVTVVSIPSEILSPPNEKLEILPKEPIESWDTFSSANTRDLVKVEDKIEVQDNFDTEDNISSTERIINLFTDNPWSYIPASLILAIVIISCFAIFSAISQKKNSNNY